MDIYKLSPIWERTEGISYVGRGIVIGKSEDGKKACAAYFIMGRSANSRNRVFVLRDGALFTEPYAASRVEDPSLIIYAAVRRYRNHLIVTNGAQTDTIYDFLATGGTFEDALRTRYTQDLYIELRFTKDDGGANEENIRIARGMVETVIEQD